jgi:hypothetical protein
MGTNNIKLSFKTQVLFQLISLEKIPARVKK